MAEFTAAIEVAAPPEVVHAFLTTEAGLTAWLGQHAEVDPRPGGRFAVDIAGHLVRGRYLHVEPTRVVVSWGFAGSDELPQGASTVEFRLVPTPGGTRVELTHADLPDPAVEGHADGWGHFLPRLAAAGSGDDPGLDRWRPLRER